METTPRTPAARPATPRWRRFLPLLVIVPVIALALSGLITWINLGGGDGFVGRWMRAFFTALPVMPLGMLTLLALERLLASPLATLPRLAAGVLLSLCSALVMEALLASAVTLSNHGPGAGFPAQWARAFAGSLPLGIVIGLLMNFVVKPRLKRSMEAA